MDIPKKMGKAQEASTLQEELQITGMLEWEKHSSPGKITPLVSSEYTHTSNIKLTEQFIFRNKYV